jgi:hypothetical protein
MKALIELDQGNEEEAVDIMRQLMQQALERGRSSNNRTLMWTRLSLARLLRRRGEDDAALSLFSDLVEPGLEQTAEPTETARSESESGPGSSPHSLSDEPEPAEQLRVTELVLKHLRQLEFVEAKELLREYRLQWKRPKDLWIDSSGPQVDLGYVKDFEDVVGGGLDNPRPS